MDCVELVEAMVEVAERAECFGIEIAATNWGTIAIGVACRNWRQGHHFHMEIGQGYNFLVAAIVELDFEVVCCLHLT